MLLVDSGFDENAVWDMPISRFHAYVEAAIRKKRQDRAAFYADTLAAISAAFGGKKSSAKEYMNTLLEDDDG